LRKATMDGGGNGSLFFVAAGIDFDIVLQIKEQQQENFKRDRKERR